MHRRPHRSFCAKRSEERRGGKEGRSRWSPYHLKKEHVIRDKLVTGVQTCALPISAPACSRGDTRRRLPRCTGGLTDPFAPRDRKSVVEGKRVDLGGRRII